MNKTYILTGGTGFLGSLLSVELIKRGDKVIFLGRGKNGETFDKRIRNTLKIIDSALSLDNIEVFEIDLNSKNLGLPENAIEKFKNKIDGIWHLAANLSFKERNRQTIFSTNVDGLKNILEFATLIKAPVYYASTAYVHGQKPGIVFEDELIKPNRFNNPYEESKFEAEKIVKKWGAEKNNKFIIFRPSILIERERKTLSFFGYYAVVHSLYKMKKKVGDKQLKISIPFLYSKDAFLNLMPIDIAIDWMMKISSNPEAIGKTFNITNPLPFPMGDITKQTFEALNIKIPVFGAPKWFTKFYFSTFYFISFIIKPLRGLAKKLYYYKYYMTEYNVYDMKNTKEIIGDDLVNQFQFAPNFIENITREFIDKMEEIFVKVDKF